MVERLETITVREVKIKKALMVLTRMAAGSNGIGARIAGKNLIRAVSGEKSICKHCEFLQINDSGRTSCSNGHDLIYMYNDDHYLFGDKNIECKDRKDLNEE